MHQVFDGVIRDKLFAQVQELEIKSWYIYICCTILFTSGIQFHGKKSNQIYQAECKKQPLAYKQETEGVFSTFTRSQEKLEHTSSKPVEKRPKLLNVKIRLMLKLVFESVISRQVLKGLHRNTNRNTNQL